MTLLVLLVLSDATRNQFRVFVYGWYDNFNVFITNDETSKLVPCVLELGKVFLNFQNVFSVANVVSTLPLNDVLDCQFISFIVGDLGTPFVEDVFGPLNQVLKVLNILDRLLLFKEDFEEIVIVVISLLYILFELLDSDLILYPKQVIVLSVLYLIKLHKILFEVGLKAYLGLEEFVKVCKDGLAYVAEKLLKLFPSFNFAELIAFELSDTLDHLQNDILQKLQDFLIIYDESFLQQ